MAQNLMNSAHKASSQAYRDGWDRTFGKDFLTLGGGLIGCEIMENEVPNASGFHLVSLTMFPDCCQICRHLVWNESGVFCKQEVEDEDDLYDHDVALAMVCRDFERISKWSEMGQA